jgi:hypothetical protein
MSGVYGTIDSRADFFRVLDEARGITRGLLTLQPKNSVIQRIALELDQMRASTSDGRVPTRAERDAIQIGLIAVRELDADRDDESGRLAKLLFGLNNYFDDWPTDATAASATEADYWKRLGL